MKALVVYYSFTGNTRKVATMLASQLGAEAAEITCPAYSYGIWGGLRQAFDVFVGGTPPIEVPVELTEDYDLVVVAGPVWAARPATPLRSFVRRYLPVNAQLGLFVTCNGTSEKFPPEKAMSEILRLSQLQPVATHIFREADVFGEKLDEQVNAFAKELKDKARLG